MGELQRLEFLPPDPSAARFDPMAMAKMRAENYNSTQGSLTGYDCKNCKNRGGFLMVQEDGSTVYRDCTCVKIRSCIRKLEASGLRTSVEGKHFDSYQATVPWQQTIKAAAEAYAKHPEGWFLICGQSGSGKTHLCTAICYECLMAGIEVRYLPWRDEIPLLKSIMDAQIRDEKMRKWKLAQILYIDDLFKTGAGGDGPMRPSSADINIAFEILNYRYVNRMSTLISTEFSPQSLLQIDEALGGRILEQASGHTYFIKKDPTRNYRLRQINMV